jgi:hypothetical protein
MYARSICLKLCVISELIEVSRCKINAYLILAGVHRLLSPCVVLCCVCLCVCVCICVCVSMYMCAYLFIRLCACSTHVHVCMISHYGYSTVISYAIAASCVRVCMCVCVYTHTTCSLPVCDRIRTISFPDKQRNYIAYQMCPFQIL